MAEFRIIITDQVNQFITPDSFDQDPNKIEVRVEVDPVPGSIEEYTAAQMYGLRLLEMIDQDRHRSEAVEAAHEEVDGDDPQTEPENLDPL